jgi:hypothetical protein
MTLTSSRTITNCPTPLSAPRLVVTAVLAPMLVWALADLAGGVELRVHQGDGLMTVGPVAIVVVSLLVAAATFGLAALLRRHSRHPGGLFLGLTGAVCLLSLAGPLGAVTATAGVALAGMHVAVAGVLISGVSRRLRHQVRGDEHNG